MTQTTNKEKDKEKVLFSRKVVLEVYEKEQYSTLLEDYLKVREIKVDGKPYYLSEDWGSFQDILESLRKKVEVLRYVNDETYKQMVEEILTDFGKLLYKLTYKHRT